MSSIKRNLIIGFEIEGLINRELHPNLKIGSYHNGKRFNKYFTAEQDSSVYGREFGVNLSCEFVSKAFKSKKVFLKAIDSFIKDISKDGQHELNEVMGFNYSCGCHFHIGITKGNRFYKTINSKVLIEMRELFFKKIDEAKHLIDYEKHSIKRQYFRPYAKRLNRRWYDRDDNERNSEFNINSEKNNKGLEWRSVNLCRVQTWAGFKEVLLIAYDCCEWLFKKRINGYKLKRETIRLPRTELLNIIDQRHQQQEINPCLEVTV